jgi:DNA-binding transcriptional LysR family regulator
MADFEWFRTFIAIYQEGTVSAAAERRGMTQPALSQHLAALESALQTSLFKRAPRQMIPTASGKLLYARLVGPVEQLESVAGGLRMDAVRSIRVRLGVPHEFFRVEGLPRLPGLQAQPCELHVTLGETHTLLRGLESGALDVVIATQKVNRRAWHYQPLMTETFIVIGHTGLEPHTDLPPAEAESWLSQQAWIAYAADLPIIRRYWQDAFGKRPAISPRLVLPDLLGIIQAVTLGVGVSVVPAYLCRQQLNAGTIRELWTSPTPSTNTLYLVCQRDRLQTPEVEWVAQLWALA